MIIFCTIFQSALPRGERPICTTLAAQVFRFQSALPRGERPQAQALAFFQTGISIRAPARGATYSDKNDKFYDPISIRAPARGATRTWHGTRAPSKHFNPRSREGSDFDQIFISVLQVISIRAPARGATSSLKSFSIFDVFQSALPRGERQRKLMLPWLHRYFNPRSREGSDQVTAADQVGDRISIRAPARGATYAALRVLNVTKFQSALPRGERLTRTAEDFVQIDFNPRSREGSDTPFSQKASPVNISIRAPARGATVVNIVILGKLKFQSALPRGERRLLHSHHHRAG